VGFKPTISAGERPKTYTLDRAATGIGNYYSTDITTQRGKMAPGWAVQKAHSKNRPFLCRSL